VTVCDVDEAIGQNRAATVEEATGKKPAYVQDLRRGMGDKSIDIVTIPTPHHLHPLAAIWAMQARKDESVGKPAGHHLSEGRRIVETARKHGRICHTGPQCRSMGGSIQAIEYIRSGKIGDVKLARGLCYKNRPSIGEKGVYSTPAGVDYDLWTGPAPKKKKTPPRLPYGWAWPWDSRLRHLADQRDRHSG